MERDPTPIERFLTPVPSRAVPDGFSLIDSSIRNGLPHKLPLDGDANLILRMPTGLARTWRDADPTTLVNRSDEQRLPPDPNGDYLAQSAVRPPLRLVLVVGGRRIAAAPLVLGGITLLPAAGGDDRPVRIAMKILSWDIRAGSLRGPGEFGSRIALAWRRADRAEEAFSAPPLNPYLQARLDPDSRIESMADDSLRSRYARTGGR